MTTPAEASPPSEGIMRPPRGSWPVWGMLALLVPAGLSLFHSVASSRTLAAVSGPDRPALAFDQYMVNFGEPHPRLIHEVQFHFDNRSSRPVKITGVDPSCGCLTPKIVGYDAQRRREERKEFAPGEHGVLAMGIRPAKEQPGDKSYTVTIRYDDGQPRTETLEFRITLPKKKLTVEPNELYFYQLSGEPDTRVVMVRDFRDTPANVTGVKAVTGGRQPEVRPLPDVTVELGESAIGADGEMSWAIQVNVAPVIPPGRQDGWLVITTDDPDAPQVKIPILLFGKEATTASEQKPGTRFYGPTPRTPDETEQPTLE